MQIAHNACHRSVFLNWIRSYQRRAELRMELYVRPAVVSTGIDEPNLSLGVIEAIHVVLGIPYSLQCILYSLSTNH